MWILKIVKEAKLLIIVFINSNTNTVICKGDFIMEMFNKFKKEKMPTEKEISKSIDEFNQLWDTDIKEIWNIDNINSFVIAMTGWINEKCDYGDNISVLTPEEKTVYIIDKFQSEVNNGGFVQFLYNSGGLVANLLPSLTAIGAEHIARIYKMALKNIPCELPIDDEQRDTLLNELITEKISKIFDSCDQEFYQYSDNIEELLYHFIINNKENFG